MINFFLVIFVLKKFAFGPIQTILEQRRNRIAEGEEKLKRIEKQLAESEQTTAAAIAKANEDAVRLINEAKQGAAAFSEQKAQEAISQAQQILAKAEAAAKVTGKVLDDKDQKRINDEALAKIEG